MNNKELIERLRNAATFGTCLEAADALELADKRIAEEREQHDIMMERGAEKLAEAERKLAVAREALSAMWLHYKSLVDSGDAGNWTPEDEPVCKQAIEALAQISPKCRRFVEPPIISPAPHVGISCTARRHQSASA